MTSAGPLRLTAASTGKRHKLATMGGPGPPAPVIADGPAGIALIAWGQRGMRREMLWTAMR